MYIADNEQAILATALIAIREDLDDEGQFFSEWLSGKGTIKSLPDDEKSGNYVIER